MRLQQYLLNEIWMKSEYSGVKFEVLKNPSLRDMKSIISKMKRIRFIADNTNKKLYVWNSNEAIHNDVWNNPQIKKGREYNTLECLNGEAELFGNTFKMYNSDFVVQNARLKKIRDDLGKSDLGFNMQKVYNDSKWINKHIKIDKYLKKFL